MYRKYNEDNYDVIIKAYRKYINKYGYEATVTKRTNNLFERIENDRR